MVRLTLHSQVYDDLDKIGDAIDLTTFSQILEMDDEGDHEFSMSIVYGFFDQARETFDQMDKAL